MQRRRHRHACCTRPLPRLGEKARFTMHLPVYRIIEGRRPVGLEMPELTPNASSSVLGEYFAHAASLEAASALAYARLGRELELHGAPERLLEGCGRARVAELRHARLLGRLAERFGVRPVTPTVERLPVRSLVDIALVNIVEGFVRTTYGATAAQYRARSAEDADIRDVMVEIARDEFVHAELAFDVAVWLQAEIDPVEGVWVESALREAVFSLARELDVEVAPELTETAGVPSRVDALEIWSNLSKRVWHGLADRVWNSALWFDAA